MLFAPHAHPHYIRTLIRNFVYVRKRGGYYIEHLNVSIDASAGDRSVRVIEEYKFKFNRTYTDEYGMKRYNDSHG